jgi:hypothetical protein
MPGLVYGNPLTIQNGTIGARNFSTKNLGGDSCRELPCPRYFVWSWLSSKTPHSLSVQICPLKADLALGHGIATEHSSTATLPITGRSDER